jgi:general secretion pathway protein G
MGHAGRSAFTLVELLLVLVILATLAAIVLPKFSGRTEQAKTTAASSQITNISTALDAFEIDMGYYPKNTSGLNELFDEPKDDKNWRGPYLKQAIPEDPWGADYLYECPGKHNERGYDLMSLGPDGRKGTDDDITNWSDSKK